MRPAAGDFRLCAFPSGTGREDRDNNSNSRHEHDYFEFSSQHGVYPAGSPAGGQHRFDHSNVKGDT